LAQDDITAASGPALPSAPILLQSIIVQEKSSLGNTHVTESLKKALELK
jgi:hypothetical protein